VDPEPKLVLLGATGAGSEVCDPKLELGGGAGGGVGLGKFTGAGPLLDGIGWAVERNWLPAVEDAVVGMPLLLATELAGLVGNAFILGCAGGRGALASAGLEAGLCVKPGGLGLRGGGVL